LQRSLPAAALGLGSDAARQAGAEGPQNEVTFHRRIPVRHEVDVFVAGGGPAGIAAAVAAARQGARVFLAERNTCLGGMGTAGDVPVAQLQHRLKALGAYLPNC
jgi:NADPH-dependent 2,4-dienoyl-CoA reductase/sulfur reductase-like enzyme